MKPNETMKRKTGTRIVLAAGVLAAVILGGIVLLVLWIIAVHIDFPPRHSDASGMVEAEFGSGQRISNARFQVYGLLQGNTCYYRFDSTPDCVLAYVADKTLVEMPANSFSMRQFQSGEPYWWNPENTPSTRCFGWSGAICVLSWDTNTGRCFIKRNGG